MINVLQFTGGPIHDVCAIGDEINGILTASNEFRVTRVDEDLDVFTRPSLDQHDVIVFYYTFGEMNADQRRGLFRFVSRGKGFVGVHPAIGLESTPPDYQSFVGGWFLYHPPYHRYQVSIRDAEHPITRGLVGPDGEVVDEFFVADEQFIMSYDPRVHVLATALHKGRAHPVAWTKPWGEGRVFYLALGHDVNAVRDAMLGKLLARGILWAAGGG